MSETVIRNWLNEFSRTVAAHDHAAHMRLISRNVTVLGVPGSDMTGYDDWSKQCEYEFAHKLIKRVEYGRVQLRTVTEKRLKFMTYESITDKHGKVNARGIEYLLDKGDDGKWRLIQERILNPEETRLYDLEPVSAVS